MITNQEHKGEGDAVGRDKNVKTNNFYSSTENLYSNILSKVDTIKNARKLDLSDNDVIKVLKEEIKRFIEEEEKKPQNLVPISIVREKFRNLIEDDKTFGSFIEALSNDNFLEHGTTRVCYISKQKKFKIYKNER